MSKIDISVLSIKNIKEQKTVDLIPEFYELKKVVENSDWHNKEVVFDHIISVLDNLDKIIQGLDKETKKTLNGIVEKNTRKDLLWIATLLHDIAKPETIVISNGLAKCPNHEEKGAEKAEKTLKRFNITEKELIIIKEIIKNHGLIHQIIIPGNQTFQKEYEDFREKFSNIYLELILLAFADTIGSYLNKTKPDEFNHRINFYKKELKNL